MERLTNLGFGALVAALRKEQTDASGRTWTQGELGRVTGLGALIIADVEQGRRRPSVDIVGRLASAFRLSAAEQRELSLAAIDYRAHAEGPWVMDASVALGDLCTVCRDNPLPAYVQDDLGDIVAANECFAALTKVSPVSLQSSAPFTQAMYSSARLFFDPDQGYCKRLQASWSETSVAAIRFFRKTTLRNRTSPLMQVRLTELLTLPAFRTAWRTEIASDVPAEDSEVCTHDWFQPGIALSYVWAAVPRHTQIGTLQLVVTLPQDRHTLEFMADLSITSQEVLHHFADWPKPDPSSPNERPATHPFG